MEAKEMLGKKVLVTTQNWFYGADGLTYRSIYGTLNNVKEAKDIFGFTPNRSHANWVFEIGDMAIMGCQILYVQQCDDANVGIVDDYTVEKGEVIYFKRPSAIYDADKNLNNKKQ